jgi:tetratricopeptide (TPR) repeat protein
MKKIMDICKIILRMSCLAIICSTVMTQAVFATDITSYTYVRSGSGDNDYYPVPAPSPYNYEKSVYARDLGVNSLHKVTGMFVSDKYLYISNGDNVIITDHNFKTIHVIDSFKGPDGEEKLTDVNGIWVTKDEELYVCDTVNGRILNFNSDWTIKRILGRPKGIIISEEVKYQPLKITVDSVGRMYVIANNVYEGILELNVDGSFSRYFGTVPVRFTAAQLFWRSLQTQKQRAKSIKWLPVNFSNLTIDGDDFVYATVAGSAAEEPEPIRKFNAKGVNILRYPVSTKVKPHGDLYVNKYGQTIPTGKSILTAVDVNEYGVYVLLDTKRSRIFAYDDDGYMLYAFGESGIIKGRFQLPADVKFMNDKLLVLDRGNMSIEVFGLNDYGKSIYQAVKYQAESNYRGAADEWRKVLEYNPTFQYGFVGVGKALYRDGDYQNAQQYFLLGQDVGYYSEAFRKNRQAFFNDKFPIIVTAIVLLYALSTALKVMGKRRLKKQTEEV